MSTTMYAVPAQAEAVNEGQNLRGIYRYEYRVEGCAAYFALTSRGDVLGRGLRVVWPGESKAAIVAELERELRAFDPVRPMYLTLHADDEPSTSPTLTLIEALDLDSRAFARWLYQ